MSYLEPQDWTFPVPIAYGPNRLRDIAAFCTAAGMSKPLIVTDKGSANLPFLTQLMNDLSASGLVPALYAEISPNPRDSEISGGKAVYLSGQHDGIIAIGGGSGMDGGKAVALTANNDVDLWSFEYRNDAPDVSDFPPLICVPTTAGTGAETESTAMITDTARLMKWCLWHPKLKPSLAILDPVVTLELPRDLTAWTGVDALVHAIEAFCVPDMHPLCDGAALEGMRLLSRWLPEVVSSPHNIEARGAMLTGSCLAGVSFLKGLGLVHAISHMVGAEFDTHHGLTNAILLPSVLRFNAPEIADQVVSMSQAMGLTDPSFHRFYAHICATLDQIEIPKSLAEIGVPIDCAERIAHKAMEDSAFGTNPRPATQSQIAGILKEAIDFGR